MFFLNLQDHLIKTRAFALKSWLITRKRPFHLFEILFWPLLGLISVGLLARFLDLEARLVQFVLVGVVALNIVQVSQIDMAYVVLYSIWNRSLKHEMAAPVNVLQLVVGSWATGILHACLVFVFLNVFSAMAFRVHLLQAGFFPLGVLFVGLVLFGCAVGTAVCAMAFGRPGPCGCNVPGEHPDCLERNLLPHRCPPAARATSFTSDSADLLPRVRPRLLWFSGDVF